MWKVIVHATPCRMAGIIITGSLVTIESNLYEHPTPHCRHCWYFVRAFTTPGVQPSMMSVTVRVRRMGFLVLAVLPAILAQGTKCSQLLSVSPAIRKTNRRAGLGS